MFLGRDNGVLKSETLNLVQNNRVNSLALLFCRSSSNQCPFLHISLYFLLPLK